MGQIKDMEAHTLSSSYISKEKICLLYMYIHIYEKDEKEESILAWEETRHGKEMEKKLWKKKKA